MVQSTTVERRLVFAIVGMILVSYIHSFIPPLIQQMQCVRLYAKHSGYHGELCCASGPWRTYTRFSQRKDRCVKAREGRLSRCGQESEVS